MAGNSEIFEAIFKLKTEGQGPVKDLQTSVKGLDKNLDELEKQSKETGKGLETLGSKEEKLSKSLKAAESALKGANNMLAEARQKLDEGSNEVSAYEDAIKGLTLIIKENEKAARQLADSGQANTEAYKKLKAETSSLVAEREAYLKQARELKTTEAAIGGEIDGVSGKFDTLSGTLGQAGTTMAALGGSIGQVAGGLTGMGSLLASIPGQMKSINDAGGSMSDKLMAGATSIGSAVMMGIQLFDSWVQGQDAIVKAAGEAGEEVLNLADAYEVSGKSLEDNVALVNGLGDANANLKSSLLAVVTDQEAFNAQLAVAKEEARKAKIAAQELNEGGLNPMLRFLTDLDPAMKAHRMRLAEQTIATEEAVAAQVAMAQALKNVQNQLQATLTEGSQKLKEINQSLIETFGTEAEQDKAKIQAILDEAQAKMKELAPLVQKAQIDSSGLQKSLELAKKRRDEFITALKYEDQTTGEKLSGAQVWIEIGNQLELAYKAFGKNVKVGRQEIESFISEWTKSGVEVSDAVAKTVGVTVEELRKSEFNWGKLGKIWAGSKADLEGLAKNLTEVSASTDALNKATGEDGIIKTYEKLRGLTRAQAEALYEQEKAAKKLIATYVQSQTALQSLTQKIEEQNKNYADKAIELKISELEKLGKVEEAEALKKQQRTKAILESLEADRESAKLASEQIKAYEKRKDLNENEKKTLESLRAQVKAYNDLEKLTLEQTEDLYKRQTELTKVYKETTSVLVDLQNAYKPIIAMGSETAKALGNILPTVEYFSEKIKAGFIEIGLSEDQATKKAEDWANQLASAIASGHVEEVTNLIVKLSDEQDGFRIVLEKTEDGFDKLTIGMINGLKLTAEQMASFKRAWENANAVLQQTKDKLAAIDAAEQYAVDHIQKKLAWLENYWKTLDPDKAKGYEAIKKLLEDLKQFPELSKEIWDSMGKSAKNYYDDVNKLAKEAHDKQIQLLKDQASETKKEYDNIVGQLQGIIGQLKSERQKLVDMQQTTWEEILSITDPTGSAMEKAIKQLQGDVDRYLSIRTEDNAAKIDQAIRARRLQIRAELQKTFESMGLTTETTRLMAEFDKRTAELDKPMYGGVRQSDVDRVKVIREALTLMKSGITDSNKLWEELNKKVPKSAQSLLIYNSEFKDMIISAFADPTKGIGTLEKELDKLDPQAKKVGTLADEIERIDRALAEIAKQGIQLPIEQTVFQKVDELLEKLPKLSGAMADFNKQLSNPTPFEPQTIAQKQISEMATGLVTALTRIRDGAQTIEDVLAGLPESITPSIRGLLEASMSGGQTLQESTGALEQLLYSLQGDEFTQGIVQFYKMAKQSTAEIKNLKTAFQSLRVDAVKELKSILDSEDTKNPGLSQLLDPSGEAMKAIIAKARLSGEAAGTQYSAGWNSKIDLKTTPNSGGTSTNSIPSLLASGIDDSTQVWESALGRMAQLIPDYFSVHSPAKLGPLSKEDPKNWTIRLMKLMSEGLISMTDLLSGNVEKVAGLLSSIGQKGLGWLFETGHFEGTSAKPTKFYGLFEDGLLTPLSEIEKQLQKASQGYSNEQDYERFVTLAQKMADKGQKNMTTTELNELTSSKFFEAFIPKMTFEDLTKNYSIGGWNPYLGWVKGGVTGDDRLLPLKELVEKKRAEGKIFEDELAKVKGELGLGFDYNLQTLTNLFKSGSEGRLDILDPGRDSSTSRKSAGDIIAALWNSSIIKTQTGLSSATATGWGIKDWFNGIREAFGFEKATNLSMGMAGLEGGDWETIIMEQVQKIKDLGFEKAAIYFKNAATKFREVELSTGNGGKGSPFAKLLDEAWIAQNPTEAQNLLETYLKGMAGGGVDVNAREMEYLQSILNRTSTTTTGQGFWEGLFAGQKNILESQQGGQALYSDMPSFGGSIGAVKIEQTFNLILQGDGSNVQELVKKIATEAVIALQTALLQTSGFR